MITKRLATLALSIVACLGLAAEAVPGIENLYRERLANGLEVYAYKDSATPIVRVQIAFKAGAIAQGADTAGLFSLYERLLLRSSGPKSSALRSSREELGCPDWNGGTGQERMDYWITVPSDRAQAAIGLWARAFASPPLDEDALEAAKAEALADIRSRSAQPDSIYEASMTRRLFAKFPWRRDPVGSEKVVSKATIDSLKALAATYLVPRNAALFVGGDIDPDEVFAAAQAAFGGWAAAPDPWAKALVPNPRPGVVRPTWIVYPDPSMPEGMGRIEARYRGPDLASDPQASYAADLWSSLVSEPSGRFKTALEKSVQKLGGPESIEASYISQRDGGEISISSYFAVDPALPAVDRARAFKERARGYEMTAMKSDPSYFSEADYAEARRRLVEARAQAAEGAEGMIDELAFWWAAASVDYFAGYPASIAKAGPKDLAAFLDTYIMRNLEVVAVRMSEADYEKEKKAFARAGFEVVGPDEAFWWRK
jgi:Predicted Zn-dependent peptidases